MPAVRRRPGTIPTVPTIPNIGVLSSDGGPRVPTIMGTPVATRGVSPYRNNTITMPADIQVGELVVIVVRAQMTGTTFDGSVGVNWDLLVDRRDTPGSNRGMVAFGWPCVDQAAVDTIVNTAPVVGTPSGGRSVYIAFRVAGVNLTDPIGTAALASSHAGDVATATIPKFNYLPGELICTVFGTESRSGEPYLSTSNSWAASTRLLAEQEPPPPTGSRTTIELWTAPRSTPPAAPDQTVTYSGTVAAIGMMSWTFRSKTAPPPLPGIPTVAELATLQNFKVGHRGSSANWPEFSMYGYTQAARYGVHALEISLNRTSDGVWFGMHDADLGRVSGDPFNTDPTTLTWAALNASFDTLGSTAALDPTQPDRPFATFQEIATAFPRHVLIIDPKYRWSASEQDEFFALLDTYGGGQKLDGTPTTPQQRCIIKGYCDSIGPDGVATRAATEGYKSWGYFYDANFADWSTYAPAWDWLSVDAGASPVNWATARATATADSKPLVGHVIGNQTNLDLVLGYGADGIMASNIQGLVVPPLA